SPIPQSSEKEGTTIHVVLSKGPPPVPVPSLTGLDCANAIRVLKAANLQGQCPALEAYSSSIASGQVINWSSGGSVNPTQAPYGSTIAIAVSKGPQPIPVPSIPASDTYAQAQAALQQAGLQATES